jgi:hypothetical protein
MATQLIKVAKDRDLYVEWDMVGSEPVWIGNREHTKAYVAEEYLRRCDHAKTAEALAEKRILRADTFGTSRVSAGCDWESGGIIYHQQFLPRRNIAILADRLLAAPGWDVDFEDLVEDTDD